MTAAVWQVGGEHWTRAQGADLGDLHYWASVGKLLTGATLLRLDADGRLSLDDPVSRYLDDVPNGNLITLRMLLAHTAGLPGAGEVPQSTAATGALTLSDEIEWLQTHGPFGCPGASWQYSNSGYALLGGVIESVTGLSYDAAVTDLLLSRGTVTNLRMVARDDALNDIVPLVTPQQARPFDVRAAQAAGGAVADARSMSQFLLDLLSGQIVPLAQVMEMFAELYPMDDPGLWYGAGAMVYDVPGDRGTTLWFGHSGGAPGATAIVAYSPLQSAIVAVAITGSGSAEASANLLLAALNVGP
ncbi:beta-lactamase family protein (plasmid) [Phaeobacter inhibens]|nr:beta-lactamase family protein [Phaeobacter inhibens]